MDISKVVREILIRYLVERLNIPSVVDVRDRGPYSIKPFLCFLLSRYGRSGSRRH